MLTLLLGAALAATPQSITVAFPDAKGVNVDVGVVSFLGEHFAQELKRAGLKVVTTREMSALLGMEQQRQVLGCGDVANSCMGELASALGADVVVLTDIAKLGAAVRLNAKAISGKDGKTLSLYSDRVNDDDAAAESLSRAARQMAGELRLLLRGEPSPVAPTASGPGLWWVPVAVGGVAALAGGAFYLQGTSAYAELTAAHTPPLSSSRAIALRDDGLRNEQLGVALVGVGVAAVLGGVAWKLLGSAPATVAVVPDAHGGVLAVSGSWP